MGATDPYFLAWRNQGFEAAKKLAIQNGENIVVVPSTKKSKAIIANPTQQLASVYDTMNTNSNLWLVAAALIGFMLLRKR